MAFKNTTATYTLRMADWAGNDPESEDYEKEGGSFWTFRAQQSDQDADAIQAMTTKTSFPKLDRTELRKRQRKGEDIEEYIASQVTQETLMSTRHAALQHMAVAWGGPEFTLPEGFEVKTNRGEVVTDPHAGKVPPCTARYIGLQDAFLIEDVYKEMTAVWAGRTPEEAAFPVEPAPSVDRPGNRRQRARAVPEAEAAA